MAKNLSAIFLSLILVPAAATAAPGNKRDSRSDEQQYCLTFRDETGSHLARTECRTRKEWRQLGIDVDQLASKDGISGGLA
jgi:hypothetical protein